MTVKEYLNQYRNLNLMIDSKLEQITRLRSIATRVSPAQGEGGSGNVSDRIGNAVVKIVYLEGLINADIDRLIELKAEIETVIGKVGDGRLQNLLTLRYINGMTFEQIADEMDYSYKQICRIHGKALFKLKDVLECPIQSMI